MSPWAVRLLTGLDSCVLIFARLCQTLPHDRVIAALALTAECGRDLLCNRDQGVELHLDGFGGFGLIVRRSSWLRMDDRVLPAERSYQPEF